MLIGPLLISPANPPDTYRLVWSDEFNVSGRVKSSEWDYEEGFVRNHEAQLYQKDNVTCFGGRLIITGRREHVKNPRFTSEKDRDWQRSRQFAEYTSGCIVGKRSFLYGRFVMRARFDTDDGLWPAFWTLGSAHEWPACGEIDIMEYYRKGLLANFAWGSNKRWSATWNSKTTPIADVAKMCGFATEQDWSKQFHTWRMDWDEHRIRIYMDDYLLNSMDLSKTLNADGTNPFHEPQHILLNLAIGGDSGGNPALTQFPKPFEVDWVRVYQQAP